jgi:sulfate permease, SulP family
MPAVQRRESRAGPAESGRPPFRERLADVAGGFGDLGLFLPIAIAMITLNGLNATAVFAGAGILYLAAALVFRVPVPVQPLKAFAAAAIALGLDAATIAAGALLMALIIGGLGASGLAGWIAARFPLVLVRGIQAAVALLLAKAAFELAARANWEGAAAIDPLLSFALAAAALALLWIGRSGRLPASLIVLAGGAAVGLAAAGLPELERLGPQAVEPALPSAGAFATALTALVIAQVPLTFGNSIVATADAERAYFGERAARVQPDRLSLSVAAGNALAGISGGMPVCHGAGGVTAHYATGARTALATASVGASFVALALVFGASLPALAMVVAPGALAGMLAFVALEHARLAARLERPEERAIALAVGAVTLLAGNLAVGFAVGVLLLCSLRLLLPAAPQPASAGTVTNS